MPFSKYIPPRRLILACLVLVGLGLAAPYLVAFILYRLPFMRLTQYPYMRACMVLGSVVAYLILRTPQAPQARGMVQR